MACAIRLLRADPRSISDTEVEHRNTIVGQCRGKVATAFNVHIAKIAALPSFEKVCYFCRELLVGKCVGSRNFSNMLGVSRQHGTKL